MWKTHFKRPLMLAVLWQDPHWGPSAENSCSWKLRKRLPFLQEAFRITGQFPPFMGNSQTDMNLVMIHWRKKTGSAKHNATAQQINAFKQKWNEHSSTDFVTKVWIVILGIKKGRRWYIYSIILLTLKSQSKLIFKLKYINHAHLVSYNVTTIVLSYCARNLSLLNCHLNLQINTFVRSMDVHFFKPSGLLTCLCLSY